MLKLFVCTLFLFSTLFAEKSQEAFHDKSAWFNAFLEATDQKIVLRERILDALKEKPLWEQIEDPNKDLSLLLVGVGNGGIELALLKDLENTRGSNIRFSAYCEDPSEQMKVEFYQNAKEAGVASTIKEYSLLNFEDPRYQPSSADFVLASHVWYYCKEWQKVPYEQNSLAKFYHLINPNGIGLIALQSCTSDRYAFLSGYSQFIGQTLDVAGEDLAAEYDRLSIPYKIEIVEAHTSLKNCFQNGQFNPNLQGKHLLSFLLRTWWDDIPLEIQEKLIEHILLLVKTNKAEEFIFRDVFIWL